MTTLPSVTIHRSVTKALKRFDSDRLYWLDAAAAKGPLAALRMGPVKLVVVTDPEVARSILLTDGASWIRPPATLVPIRLGVGENLFTQPDQAWAEVQPSVAPAFRKKALDARLAVIGDLIADEVAAIPRDTTVDLDLALGRIALVLAAWVLLGERLDGSRAEEIAHHQREVVSWVGAELGKLTGFVPVAVGARAREMKRHRTVLDAYADEVISRRAAGARREDDVLGALLTARPGGRALTPSQLRGHVLGLFLAGNETTATALSWMLVNGAAAPDEWARVAHGDAATCAAFVTESLRLHPAVWGIPRTPSRAGMALTSGGVTIAMRRGQIATVYVRGMNRDETRWPEPLRFMPARHGDHTRDQQQSLLPFGLGARGCIGQHLALAEMEALLPELARHGAICVEGTPVENPEVALRVKGGLRGRFVTRPATRARERVEDRQLGSEP